MTTPTVVMAVFAATTPALYQNDFSTRMSTDLQQGEAWTRYAYEKGGPLAYNFVRSANDADWYAQPYSGPSQDGWTKCYYQSKNSNNGYSAVSNEEDPALVFSDKDVKIDGTSTQAANHQITLMHPLRNVFTNGDIKIQFDIRQPNSENANMSSWLRLVEACDMDLKTANHDHFLMELGLSAQNLTGAWRKAGDPDGKRSFYTVKKGAAAKHWYRYYVTHHCDAGTSDFEVYDLGENRLDMDEKPTGEPIASQTQCPFRWSIGGERGGISGIMIRCNAIDTVGYYGETGYDDDLAYKYDNIKVSWKAPGAATYKDCYRNDFTCSNRRTVDGRFGASHAYDQTTGETTATFVYDNSLIRAADDRTKAGMPFLPAPYDTALSGNPQRVGIDGWRMSGDANYTNVLVVTTNNVNQMLYVAANGMFKQPMCPEVTSGTVKFEFDQRMPAGWTGTGRIDVDLLSERAYEEGVSNSSDSLLRCGLSSTGKAGSKVKLETSYSVYTNGASVTNTDAGLAASTWYRLQEIINLDEGTATLNVYEIGTDAPASPDGFQPSEGNRKATYALAFKKDAKYRTGIGTWGFTNFLSSEQDVGGVSAKELECHIDNVRFWKQDGSDWKLLFVNDFTTSSRTFVGNRLAVNPSAAIDRMELGEDGWAARPDDTGTTYVAGDDAVLRCDGQHFSLVCPLGRSISRGTVCAWVDFRLPNYWRNDRGVVLALGGGTMASASTAGSPYSFDIPVTSAGLTPAREIQSGKLTGKFVLGSTGARTSSGYWGESGSSATIWYGACKYAGSEFDFASHWIRVKVIAYADKGKYDLAFYDMGAEHPAPDAPEGSPVKTFSGLSFRRTDEAISHIAVIGGMSPSYQPWKADAPGAVLVDNVAVRHSAGGLLVSVR